MSLTHEDVRKILAILEEAECEEAEIRLGDFSLRFSRQGKSPAFTEEKGPESGAAQVDRAAKAAGCAPGGRAASVRDVPDDGLIAVTAPMLGTFYRSSSPGEQPFVEEGNRVKPEDTVCLLEVMKLFNSVKAGVTGRVERILVDNGALVEYGQPLMLLRQETLPPDAGP